MTELIDREVDSTAEALLELLAARGVDYLFGNAGTDFAPVIEALSKAAAGRAHAPTPLTVPHENLAVAMAHGYYLATGRPQAVMVHVNVGTGNTLCGLINAARENVPLLLLAGRTPIHESGVHGARNAYIHWAQEMFDQSGMVREAVKWDYELRSARQVEAVVDRALAVAMTDPKGPVYLTLPREVLAAGGGAFRYHGTSTLPPAEPAAAGPTALERTLGWLAGAERAVCITSSYGRTAVQSEALARFAETCAVGVIPYRTRYVPLAHDHPCHLGFEPAARLSEADLVLVVESDVPWIPDLHHLAPGARVVQIGADALFQRYPVRTFPADLCINADPATVLDQLCEGARATPGALDPTALAARRRWVEAHRAAPPPPGGVPPAPPAGPITGAWLADCIEAVRRPDDVIVGEMAPPIGRLRLPGPGSYFGMAAAGGLGWGMGASIGVKLARPDRRVMAVVGDGSYMFGNPTPAHFVQAAYRLPTLTVIVNNRMWGAVRRATLSLYPDGEAARANQAPLTYLEPSPSYEKVVAASGGWGALVERPDALADTLAEGLRVVEEERRPAVVNVITHYRDDDATADARR